MRNPEMPLVRRASAAEMPVVRGILSGAGLPTDDFREGEVDFFVADEGGRIVGTIGLEAHPPAGLLRSAAVLPEMRGGGIGRLLVAAIVAEARARGFSEIVLLTTDAEGFFSLAGFERVPRESVGAEIAESAQFRGTRCSSAAVMRLGLR